MSFSGGKDSLALAHLVYSLIQSGEIDPAMLTVLFIDEEAIFDCIEATTKAYNTNYGTARQRARETLLKNRSKK